jgi:methionyl aminopeptidase
VIAAEPMIAAGADRVIEGPDGWTIRTADGSSSAHYEHTVMITNYQPLLLTAA